MPRIRSVHPGLFTDEAFAQLSDGAQVFLIGIWTEADDQGVFEWKPITLKMRLRPASLTPVEPLLEELIAANCVRKFCAAGRHYGAIRNFQRFQRPKKPNSIHPVPVEFRTYLGLTMPSSEPDDDDGGISSELDSDEAPSVPPKSEIIPQMEDGGGKRKDGKKAPPAPPRGGRQPKNPIPPDWRPSEAGATYARERGVDLAVQVPKFVRHHLGNDSRRADFSPYWLNWCDGDLSAKHPKSADPDLAGKQTAMLEGWLKRLRDHHGEAINGTSVADVDRVYRKFSGVNFLGFLDAVEAGEAWLLDELHSGAAA